MDVLVAGGHGQIARRLLRLLAQHGHTARGLIRNPDHVADLESDGAHPILCDLEHDDVRPHVGGADAVVFAAGAGAGSGDARKQTLDYGGAVKCIDAARELGVERLVMVSAMYGHVIPEGPMRPYLLAKKGADDALMDSGLDWTVVKPGRLTDAPGSGTGGLARSPGRAGEIPRDDVALVLLPVLGSDNPIRGYFDLLSGSTPAREAVA